MVDGTDDFKGLMQRLGDGDSAAAELVVNRYGDHLAHAIKRRLRSQRLRVRYGTDDCLQSVWKSIFSDIDRLAKIETPKHLMNYLAKVASNKLIDRDRQLKAQRNDVYRECELPEADSPGHSALAVQDLTPSQIVAIDDEWKVRTEGLSEEQKKILELHRMGHSSDEIAEQTNRSARGVRKLIQQFRELFMRHSDNDSGRSQVQNPDNNNSGERP